MQRLISLFASLVVSVFTLAVSNPAMAQDKAKDAKGVPSIKGVWQLVEITRTGPNASTNSKPQPGLWIITGKHYTYLAVSADKARPELPAAKMTDKDRSDAYNDFVAQAGNYEMKGSELIMKVFVARNPDAMRAGSVFKNTFKLDGKTLSLTQTANQNGPIANPTTYKLVRIE